MSCMTPQVVVMLVQGQPRGGDIAGLQPAAHQGALAVTGRGRDQSQRPLQVPAKPAQADAAVHVVSGNRRLVQLGAEDGFGYLGLFRTGHNCDSMGRILKKPIPNRLQNPV